ncbi:MAG: hypothetical protein LBP73_11245 [Clostridiales Family XIII bacterium]|jgi:dissimilatory sulfite reductase (desulfoviridin) alpha/beta subunit|nr:hypothetical protein [Clostridiales Family XIII bacterium]
MLCGVKFCGGCNPRYERGKALAAVKEHFGENLRFAYAEEGRRYDLLLYIAGCANRCTALGAYPTDRGIVSLWDEESIREVCARMEELLRG